jgi:hypothetical protein
MILREFSSTPTQSINKLNQRLNEQYGITVKQRVYTKSKLEALRENALKNIQRLKLENHKFQLDPDYAKYLGVKDITEIMLREGMYRNGRAYREAEEFIREMFMSLVDEGYGDVEAKMETLNRCRQRPDSLADSVYEEIMERCMMEMTSAGGMAMLEDDEEGAPSGNIHEQIRQILDQGGRVISQAMGRVGEVTGVSDDGASVKIISLSSGRTAFTSFLDGDPVVLQQQSNGDWYIENIEQELEEDGYGPGIDEGEIRDWITSNAGNGAGLSQISENEYEYVIEVYVPNHDDDNEVLAGPFRELLWEICEEIGCVDVQGPEFTHSHNDAEYWSWRLMKDIGSEEMYEAGGTQEEQIRAVINQYPKEFDAFVHDTSEDYSNFVAAMTDLLRDEMPIGVQNGDEGSAEDYILSVLEDLGLVPHSEDAPLEEELADDWHRFKVWIVPVPATVYDGKYYDYKYAPLKLIDGHNGVDSAESAVAWAMNNPEKVYAAFRNVKTQSGRRYVAHPVEDNMFVDRIAIARPSEISTRNLERLAVRSPNFDPAMLDNAGEPQENTMTADEIIRENVNVDEAEVVMALRAQSNILADQIEKLGRMINEDLIKITEQISNEMGQDTAAAVQSAVTDALQQHLESARSAKEAMDEVVSSVAQGQAPGVASPDLDAEEPGGDMPDMDLDLDDEFGDEEMGDEEGADINEPAASGPTDEPMGRREI